MSSAIPVHAQVGSTGSNGQTTCSTTSCTFSGGIKNDPGTGGGTYTWQYPSDIITKCKGSPGFKSSFGC